MAHRLLSLLFIFWISFQICVEVEASSTTRPPAVLRKQKSRRDSLLNEVYTKPLAIVADAPTDPVSQPLSLATDNLLPAAASVQNLEAIFSARKENEFDDSFVLNDDAQEGDEEEAEHSVYEEKDTITSVLKTFSNMFSSGFFTSLRSSASSRKSSVRIMPIASSSDSMDDRFSFRIVHKHSSPTPLELITNQIILLLVQTENELLDDGKSVYDHLNESISKLPPVETPMAFEEVYIFAQKIFTLTVTPKHSKIFVKIVSWCAAVIYNQHSGQNYIQFLVWIVKDVKIFRAFLTVIKYVQKLNVIELESLLQKLAEVLLVDADHGSGKFNRHYLEIVGRFAPKFCGCFLSLKLETELIDESTWKFIEQSAGIVVALAQRPKNEFFVPAVIESINQFFTEASSATVSFAVQMNIILALDAVDFERLKREECEQILQAIIDALESKAEAQELFWDKPELFGKRALSLIVKLELSTLGSLYLRYIPPKLSFETFAELAGIADSLKEPDFLVSIMGMTEVPQQAWDHSDKFDTKSPRMFFYIKTLQSLSVLPQFSRADLCSQEASLTRFNIPFEVPAFRDFADLKQNMSVADVLGLAVLFVMKIWGVDMRSYEVYDEFLKRGPVDLMDIGSVINEFLEWYCRRKQGGCRYRVNLS